MMHLESNDGTRFEILKEHAKVSKLLSEMLEEDESDDRNSLHDNEVIPLPSVSSEQLTTVVKFCTEFGTSPIGDIQKPLPNIPFGEIVGDTYAGLMDLPHKKLMGLLDASMCLMIPALTELVYTKLAFNLKGKTVEQIRKIYGIETDMTQEEEDEVYKKYCCFLNLE
jgi:hypothetical protein